MAQDILNKDDFITYTIFREKFVNASPFVVYAGMVGVALLPLLVYYRIAELRWILAWEALALVGAIWRILLSRFYRKHYPSPNFPINRTKWIILRHTYHAYTWLVIGLATLFAFLPRLESWEIGAVAGVAMAFSLAPSETEETSEIIISAICLVCPPLAVLLILGSTFHYSLASLLVCIIFLQAVWASDQIKLHRNEIVLRMALQHEKQMVEQANVAKSKFLAAASHDLRQPLHALTLFVEALKAKTTHVDTHDTIRNIENSVAALNSLLHSLLDISKLDAGVVVPGYRHFSLTNITRVLSAEYQLQAQAKGIRFECDCTPLIVFCDPTLLDTILRNLLSNAIRYTREGKVSIHCKSHYDLVQITVQDTGIGIPADKHNVIFREFFQLENPERDRSKGLGLGLSIVERIANLLKIRTTLESSPGQGTTFSVYVPLGEANDQFTQDNAESSNLPAALQQGKVIVVIDDEPSIREAMQALLINWGAKAIAAESHQEIIDELQNLALTPDLIIADFRLRDNVTGADAIHHLYRVFSSTIPAMIITGDTAPERLVEARDSGFLLLHKPIKPAQLRAAIIHLLKPQAQK